MSDFPVEVVAVTERDLVAGFPDAGPFPEGRPRWTFASSLASARPGDYAVLVEPETRPDQGWDLVGRACEARVYRVGLP